jgi:hypothetical protein
VTVTRAWRVTVENAAGQRSDGHERADDMMPGPDGHPSRAYRRSARQIRAGDYLPELGAHALTDAVEPIPTTAHTG